MSAGLKGRRRQLEDPAKFLDGSATLEVCCHDVSRETLAEALHDMLAVELVVPEETQSERISPSATATLDEIIRGVGLSARA
jgi:hypothetical protein